MKNICIFISFIVILNLSATIINIPVDQPTIQAGINIAAEGDTVLVQPGTYVENINYNGNNITVTSLFLSTQDSTYISNTIIDGNSFGSVVTFLNGEDESAVLTGFTITNGCAEYGAGIYINNSSPKILNCKITLNTIDSIQGAGIYSLSGFPIIINNEISDNNTFPHGTGAYFYVDSDLDSLIISNNTFINECVYVSGYCDNIFIQNNIFKDFTGLDDKNAIKYFGISSPNSILYILDNSFLNFSHDGSCSAISIGGTSIDTSTAVIMNNRFEDIDNSAIRLGGTGSSFCTSYVINNKFVTCGSELNYEPVIEIVSLSNSITHSQVIGNLIVDSSIGIRIGNISSNQISGLLVNNTIVKNLIGIEKIAGVEQLQIKNTILWENDVDLVNVSYEEISYSDISDGNYLGFNGNISENPLFQVYGENQYSLQFESPCVDMGTQDTLGLNLPQYDLANNQRIFGGRIDMGAYESQGTGVENGEFPISKIQLNNFPNPFNPSTTIEFSVNKTSIVSISVFNIKGQLIKILANNDYSIGKYSVIWNGNDENGNSVSSGLYFYKLLVNGKVEAVNKCLLLK